MPRGSLRHYSSRGRRSRLQWDRAASFLVLAIVFNFGGLYLINLLLLATFEPYVPKPNPGRGDVLEFDLYDPDAAGDAVPPPDGGDGERPDSDTNNNTAEDRSEPDNTPKTTPRERPKDSGRPDAASSGQDQGSENDQGASEDEQVGPSDDDLIAAPDGELAGSGDGQGGAHGKPDPLAGLGGSTSMLDKTFGPAPAPDRMRDVDEGVDNVLDSKRHLYGSFFNRMRDRVVEHWDPNKAHNRVDPDGSRYGRNNRTTVLMVRLDASGKLLKTVIMQKSGAPHLDEEAVRAMKAASPFPNPPSGLPDAKGHIEFLVGFTLDFSGAPRMFRMQR